jgi:hypothetical protein
MGGGGGRGFSADTVRISKNKIQKQFLHGGSFNRRATFLRMTPSNVREGCKFFSTKLESGSRKWNGAAAKL